MVELMASPYADRWESLTTAAGDAAAAERELLLGAIQMAVDERRQTPRQVIEELEHVSDDAPAYAVLALAVPPMVVWSFDEARAAAAAARGRRRSSERMDAVEEVAFSLMSFDHVKRVRVLVARLAREVPFDGLPRASRRVAAACALVEGDLEAARSAAAALLIAYAEQLIAAGAAARS